MKLTKPGQLRSFAAYPRCSADQTEGRVAADLEQEAALVDAFVVPTKRERVLALLSKPKRRGDVLDTLYHHAPLDPRCMTRVASHEQSARGIEALLRARGAPDLCYVISTDRTLDATTVQLSTALSRIVGRGEGTIVSCIRGRLGYFEAEDAGERYLLERRGGRTRG